MATPVHEQIILKVKQRLQTIDEDAGFETSVSGTVVRPMRIWTGHLQDYQIIVTQGTLARNEDLSHPGNPPAVAWDLPLTIYGELRPSEDNTTAIDTLINEFASDAIRAICTPVNAWHNWDGLAINTIVETVENFNAEETAGFKMELSVSFRTDENNPYTMRA